MSRWTNFAIDERKAMILAVSQAKQIDEAAAEKDWWVTAVLGSTRLSFWRIQSNAGKQVC